MTPHLQTDPVQAALARSAAYGFLACALRVPDPELWAKLTDRERWPDWPEIFSETDFETGEALRHAQERLLSPDPARRVPLEEARETFGRTFGHSARGAAPPYEMEYGAGEIFQRAAELSDIQGFYWAFGFEVASEAHERPDHASIECEFMSVLAAKEAYFLSENLAEGLDSVREAQRTFLESHLAKWLPAFAQRTTEADPEGFYGSLARFAARFIALEGRLQDIPCGPSLLELRKADEEEESLQACAKEDFGGACPADHE